MNTTNYRLQDREDCRRMMMKEARKCSLGADVVREMYREHIGLCADDVMEILSKRRAPAWEFSHAMRLRF